MRPNKRSALRAEFGLAEKDLLLLQVGTAGSRPRAWTASIAALRRCASNVAPAYPLDRDRPVTMPKPSTPGQLPQASRVGGSLLKVRDDVPTLSLALRLLESNPAL